jgi:hypothetical protein
MKNTRAENIKWYENLPDDIRLKLQYDFGNHDAPDRETKFYKWLKTIKKEKYEK